MNDSEITNLDASSTVTVERRHLKMLDVATQSIFGCEGVNRVSILERLIKDHDDVPTEEIEELKETTLITDGGKQIDLNTVQ